MNTEYRVTQFSYTNKLQHLNTASLKEIKFETVSDSTIDKARIAGEYDNGEQCRIITENSVVDIVGKQPKISVKYTKGCYIQTSIGISSEMYVDEVSINNNEIHMVNYSDLFTNTRIGKLSIQNTVVHEATELFVCFANSRIRECNLSGLTIDTFKRGIDFSNTKLTHGYIDVLIINDVKMDDDAVASMFEFVKVRRLESDDKRVVAEWERCGRLGHIVDIYWYGAKILERACRSAYKIVVDRRIMEDIEKKEYAIRRSRRTEYDIIGVTTDRGLVNVIFLHGKLKPIDCTGEIEQMIENGILKKENVEISKLTNIHYTGR